MDRIRFAVPCPRSCPCLAIVLPLAAASTAAGFTGPDVVYTDCHQIAKYGPVGGIQAYSLGSRTCNIGTQNLPWINDGPPGLAMNAYRLHDGRLMQIGMSWVKTACCAIAGSGCGMSCNGQGGSVLGVGCLDTYTASWNAAQAALGPRSGINAYTGTFQPIPGGSGDAIFRRLQVAQADMSATAYPGALYFVEGHYVSPSDAAAGNAMNNISYRRVTVSGTYDMTLQGTTFFTQPAINAWRDHGLGVGVPDPSVTISNVDVPGEGRFYLGRKVTSVAANLWRYDYALYNHNSDRSGGSFTVPVPAGVAVTSVGFHDVPYHSGESYDNTDWNAVIGPSGVTWSSPQSHAQNPNSNALRWGTLYNFWFTANTPPTNGLVTLGLFKPGSPATVTAAANVPSAVPVQCELVGDVNGDGLIDGSDVHPFVKCLITGGGPFGGNCDCADINGAGGVTIEDAEAFIAALIAP